MKILLVEDDPFHMGYLEEQVASALPEATAGTPVASARLPSSCTTPSP